MARSRETFVFTATFSRDRDKNEAAEKVSFHSSQASNTLPNNCTRHFSKISQYISLKAGKWHGHDTSKPFVSHLECGINHPINHFHTIATLLRTYSQQRSYSWDGATELVSFSIWFMRALPFVRRMLMANRIKELILKLFPEWKNI